jgi:hypothetical protein
MPVHKVAYDLNSPGKNYTPLLDYLKRCDSLHAQKSMWYVNTSLSAYDLATALSALVDRNDTISVSQMFKGGWCLHNMAGAVTWLTARGV